MLSNQLEPAPGLRLTCLFQAELEAISGSKSTSVRPLFKKHPLSSALPMLQSEGGDQRHNDGISCVLLPIIERRIQPPKCGTD